MDVTELFQRIEATLVARYNEAAAVKHMGDRGENREAVLREFLSEHLPNRFGVAKGEVVTRSGRQSHSADIIIFDAAYAPVLYAGDTLIVPIEAVYGIIEVKSKLSKAEFRDASQKVQAFKQLAPRELSVIQTREYMTMHRPSRPFGMIFAFDLADNSLASLDQNWEERNKEVHDVNFFENLIVILGAGLLAFEMVDLTAGERHALLDTDEFVNYMLTEDKRARNNEPATGRLVRRVIEDRGAETFGRFFVYLLLALERLRLGVVDLGRYIDPDLPFAIRRES
jgi:hypothetical protein